MNKPKTVAAWMTEKALRLEDLLTTAGLDPKVGRAIVEGRYTPSPEQRRRIAAALNVALEAIIWGHAVEVIHLYGHGPQFGRTP